MVAATVAVVWVASYARADGLLYPLLDFADAVGGVLNPPAQPDDDVTAALHQL